MKPYLDPNSMSACKIMAFWAVFGGVRVIHVLTFRVWVDITNPKEMDTGIESRTDRAIRICANILPDTHMALCTPTPFS